MILSPGNRSHRGHFSQGHHHDPEADKRPDIRPEKAGQSTINKTLSIGAAGPSQLRPV